MAFDEPNLIRYLRTDSKGLVNLGGIGAVFDEEKNKSLREALCRVVGISEEKAREFMNTVVIYTQGLVTFIIDGTITVSREEAMRMLENVGVMHMVYTVFSKRIFICRRGIISIKYVLKRHLSFLRNDGFVNFLG